MDNFDLPSRYQHARDQESASADGYTRPEHSQCIMEVLHMTATLCVILCLDIVTNMLTKNKMFISVKKKYGKNYKTQLMIRPIQIFGHEYLNTI